MNQGPLNSPDWNEVYFSLVDEIEQALRIEDARNFLHRAVAAYGLSNAAYFGFNMPTRRDSSPYLVATYSEEWIAHYHSHGYITCDPILIYSLNSIVAVDWSSFDKRAPHVRNFLADASTFKIGEHGLTFPIHGLSGEKGLFTVTSNAAAFEWNALKRILLNHFPVLALHFHHMIMRAEGVKCGREKLTPREAECLKWAAQGKTSSEIADILSISEWTARFHIAKVRRKLGATNVTHAVAKAIRRNLLPGPWV